MLLDAIEQHEKPSRKDRKLAVVASDGLAIHERPTYASEGGNFTVGLPLSMVEQEAPHSALTGADAARADVGGRLLESFRGTRAFPCAWSEFVSSGCDLFGQHLGDPWR